MINGCTICNGKVDAIQEKLDQVMLLIPEVEHLRAIQLEEDKESLRQTLEFTQAEVKELKSQIKSTTEELGVANEKLDKLDQLERRIIKQNFLRSRTLKMSYQATQRESSGYS